MFYNLLHLTQFPVNTKLKIKMSSSTAITSPPRTKSVPWVVGVLALALSQGEEYYGRKWTNELMGTITIGRSAKQLADDIFKWLIVDL